MDEQWVVVPHWRQFQHYRDRTPNWIKVYCELAHRDEWQSLTLAERGLVVSIWVEYGMSRGLIRLAKVHAKIHARPRQKQWESLVQAGFVQFVASKTLASRAYAAALAKEVEEKREETPKPPSSKPRQPRGLAKRTKAARTWLANVGDQVPADHLPEALADQFKLPDELVATLLKDMPR